MNAEKKILVCDDEPHIVHVVASKLRNGGFEVITAGDGEEAFDVAMSSLPDLIFTDYQMPGLSGLELCTKLRNESATRTIPAVMLTGRGFSLGPDDTANTNIVKILPKPFSPREILALAQSILSHGGRKAAAMENAS
jgi:DNA-binding response OmpR family regulator